ncbi:TonB-dependent receptor [Tenacibaculum tangerinum]|uniref:TonB-dependent receptor n=1 Tax=Tenacibaculum tangerinum TaxID=3038772 RepID=A0ABY8L7K8_9FLAO|nr:TonB-dependent receptor [Tenacibaculum tangerinum]WGH76368.1 TonB-dependent receptor [Tenacibaculum tangerinum]
MDYKYMFNYAKLAQNIYKLLGVFLFCAVSTFAQNNISGVVTSETNVALRNVKIYNKSGNLLAETNNKGLYQFSTKEKQLKLLFYVEEYQLKEVEVTLTKDLVLNVRLYSFSEELSEIEIKAQRRKVFELKRLKDVEETAIFAGKKTEVVLVNQSTAALASNNARQLYSQVAGLNIFQNDDAGLQLNIGGRGLDPNRTSNFNTRQNGYDISADVLGYPESYYTPPAEALDEIQIVRGAASLQYGTQFGGLVNFIMKKPNPNKPLEIITRNTLGSNNLFTNFTSVGGTKGEFSYYGYYNYKQGEGFRPNSEFDSKNAFAHVGYEISDNTKLTAEITYLKYLAQQAGGLTDAMFSEDIFQSNRTRNWFEVNWLLYNFKLIHDFSKKSKLSVNFSGLDASRNTVGYRGNYKNSQSNPVSDLDIQDPRTGEYEIRDLIKGNFKNWSVEARFLSEYNLFNKENIFLIGTKYYKANNKSRQGAGSRGIDADFNFVPTNDYISSNFTLPNENVAVFGENIFKFSDKFSVTPGFRLEYINTQSEGIYTIINYDAAGNPLPNDDNEFEDNRTKERSFALFGLGASYKPTDNIEFYGNASQNYRSVTFSDIRTVSPTFIVDENIKDSKGYTTDFGIRGAYKKFFSYDISGFGLFYNDRIGIVLESNGQNKGDRLRTNIGDAFIYGVESLIDFNMIKILKIENTNYSFNIFNNFSFIDSEYTKSNKSGVEGNKVEFIPNINLKTGVRFGYKNFLSSLQYSYLSKQYTDATNSAADIGGVREGTIGEIPAYRVLDFSTSYKYKIFKLEAGVNNLLDEKYFTRRATGYPGPGIIPSAPRNWYVTLQFKI